MFRSLAGEVSIHPLRDAVLDRVSREARALLLDPPVATAWIDARLINDVYEVLRALLGDRELRKLNNDAVKRGVSPLVSAAVERLIRVFGTSPAMLLTKFDRIAGTTSRGVVYRYEPLTDTSGTFDIEYPALRDVPRGPFVATGGALELIFSICDMEGTIGGITYVPNGRNNRARYEVTWSGRAAR
ncbi:MAG: hypothetical protein U0359_27820 [Byssovorax sp.]